MGHLVLREGEHTWMTIHHTDDEGKHYCPTGIEWCPVHGDSLDLEFCGESRDGTDVCFAWGEFPEEA